MVWSGTAASAVDLHPTHASLSQAYDVDGGIQVGIIIRNGGYRASLWRSTAASHVDLHAVLPSHFTNSYAESVYRAPKATYVVGYAYNSQTFEYEAVAWVESNLRSGPPN